MNLTKSYKKRHATDTLYEWLKLADAMMVYTLHTEFGFGKVRCERAYKKLVETHKEMKDRFACDDYSHYHVIIKRLKDDGIDIEELEKEVEEE